MRGIGLGLGWSLQETHPVAVPATIGAPIVSGSTVQGQLLTCNPGAWSGFPYRFTYQWQRDGVDISAATGQQYTTVSGDHGKAIGCVVTAYNVIGASSAQAGSNTIGPIVVVPVNSVAPAITGSTAIGATLTCSTGTWSDSPTGYAYQWKRDGVAIGGETASTHVVVNADDTHSITCTVTATNAAGSAAATSNAVTGGAWTPASLGSALKGWWDSEHVQNENSLPAANGETIKRFLDRSGNGNVIEYDTTLATFPKLRTAKSDTNFGPKDAIEFDATQILTLAAAVAPGQPFTTWHVARSTVGDKVVVGGPAWGLYIASGSGVQAYQAGNFQGSSAVNLDLWSIVIMRFDHGGATSKLRVDGATAATADPGAGAGTGLAIGDYSTGGNAMTGFVAEAGIIAGAMSDADIAKLEHYLSTQWGVDSL